MTASVSDLLDRLHRQAFAMANLTPQPSEERWRAQSVVWPKLAAATIRAINNIPTDSPANNEDLGLVDSILHPIARNQWLPTSTRGKVPQVPPDRRLVDMARVLGGIADLLTVRLEGVESDPATVLGLRANLLTPVMVAANWSLATAPDSKPSWMARRHLQVLSGVGTAFAFIPVALRTGPYDDIAAVRRSENSLDAAIHTWLDAATDALATRKGLSGVTLRTIAADLSVICGAAATLTNTAITQGHLAEAVGRPVVQAISEANSRWREASRWPQTIYLGGARHAGLAEASIRLRQTVVDALRDGKDWADTQVIARRVPRLDLLAVARRAMHAAAGTGQQHQAAVSNLFWGKDRVMIASRALEGATYMNKSVFIARRRGDWLPMPRYEPTGVAVYQAATRASDTTLVARDLTTSTARPVEAFSGPAIPPPVELSQGRIAAPGASHGNHRSDRLTKAPPFGMGDGGLAPGTLDLGVSR